MTTEDFRMATFDHLSVTDDKEPWELLDAVSACPERRSDQWGGFHVVTAHRELVNAARIHHELSSSRPGVSFPPVPIHALPIELDPPQHRELRFPLLERFSPLVIQRQERFYRDTIRVAIDEVAAAGQVEAVTELLHPIVGRIIAELLGFPLADAPMLTNFAMKIMEKSDLAETLGAFTDYLHLMYLDRLANPRDESDLPTLVMGLTIDGRQLDEDAWCRTILTLIGAGLDTTVSAGAHILEWLAEHPERCEELRLNMDLVPTAVDEFLRFITPIPSLRRVASVDIEVDGCPVSKDETVLLLFLAANHDADEFPDPHEVIFDRAPNRHVAFGSGIHRCIGSHVARLELKCLLEEVLPRLINLRPDPDDPAIRYPGTVRGIARLPLLFTPEVRP